MDLQIYNYTSSLMKYLNFSFLLIFLGSLTSCVCEFIDWENDYPLPAEHIPFFFYNNPHLKEACLADNNCPYKHLLKYVTSGCWGYEDNCPQHLRYNIPSCPGHHGGWYTYRVKTKEEQLDLFFTQGDFGFVKEKRAELKPICLPQHPNDSSLHCAKNLIFCHGRNILIDFENLDKVEQPMKYRMDVLKEGQIGGHCTLDVARLETELNHKSPLQSWAPELQNFHKYTFRPIDDNKCDIVIEKPVFLMKLDATVNMFHHFCDYVNLYLTQHMNNTFSMDVFILIWDMGRYHNNFAITWKSFSKHEVLDLEGYPGKRVCFRDLIFSFLPRMIFGMYYNMPLIDGCENSGFFHAFSKHVIHRLKIKQILTKKKTIRVTLLSRSTKYRNILNEDELIREMKLSPDLIVQKVTYNHQMPFFEQLNITHNTDIFIGMHGAGLTHLLFLPDWAVIFEIYNCEDPSCYKDLARLRGVKYITWENLNKLTKEDEGHHPTLGAHAKFTNYAFDVGEFLRLLQIAINHVSSHPKWIAAHKYDFLHEEL